MTSKHGPSIYYATDKNIFDILHNSKITKPILMKFLRSRGILVSADVAKEDLIRYVSRFTHDHFDIQKIGDAVESKSRKRRSTSNILETKVSNDEVKKAYTSMCKEREELGESFSIRQNGDTTIVSVSYTDVDYTKTELKQKNNELCDIELHVENEQLVIRRPVSGVSDEITEHLKKSLIALKDEDVIEHVVSLEAFSLPEARSYFFQKLINSIPEYKFDDVTQVGIYDNTNDQDSDDAEGVSEKVAGYIRKAVLDGDRVLNSSGFNQLHKENFYISKITWTAVNDGVGREKVEFEARFSNQSLCTEFNYSVRGIYEFNKEEGHYLNKRTATKIENSTFVRKIESASLTAFDEVKEKYGSATEDDNESS